MTLILSCDTTTKAAVSSATAAGQWSTWPKAMRYISAGSAARPSGTPARSAITARSEPNISFGAPSTIQPGPAASSDSHQDRVARPAAGRAGRKRSTSTCSPICGIRARITEAAPPNLRRSKPPPWSGPAAIPSKCVQSTTAGQSCQTMKPTGSTLRTIHSGWVRIWKRLIQAMPCVTSGITASALTR